MSSIVHQVLTARTDDGSERAICQCGWVSGLFRPIPYADEAGQSPHPARDAGDMHEWEVSMAPRSATDSAD